MEKETYEDYYIQFMIKVQRVETSKEADHS